MKKKTQVQVTLLSTDGRLQEFSAEHAEAILKLHRSDWMLPQGSPFELTADGIVSKPSTSVNQKAEKRAGA